MIVSVLYLFFSGRFCFTKGRLTVGMGELLFQSSLQGRLSTGRKRHR